MTKEIHIYPDQERLAHAFAHHLKIAIDQSDGNFNLALSGGSTPRLLFDVLATEFKDAIPWDRVHLFWGDERCVPPDHPDSNYLMTKKHLLDHIQIPEVNVHRVKGEESPGFAKNDYITELDEFLPEEESLPVFDLIILGIGADGHTASIFPDQMELLTVREWCAVATQPESGQQRITMTGNVLNQAREVCFLVAGASKDQVIQEILEAEPIAASYPASHIQPKGTLHWFLDEEAAKKMKS